MYKRQYQKCHHTHRRTFPSPQQHRLRNDHGRDPHLRENALDFDEGGDIATNLNELYSYVVRRLFHVNAHNDLSALKEIHGLMEEIRSAWKAVPGLMSTEKAPKSLKPQAITN